MQQVLETLKAQGASLVAITPQLPEHSRALAERHHYGFDLVTDTGNAYADQLGLRFTLPADLRAVYEGFGIDLAKHNGEPSWTLPMPGRFVIDRGGIVRAVDVDPDYTYRPEPQKTLDDLVALT